MEYQGFRSISEYERECARLSYKTRRVPFHDNNDGKFFALVTSCPGHPTGTSVESWALFTADETALVLDGIISGGMMDPARYMRDGLDVNYLGKLAAHGYHPDNPEDAAPKPATAPTPALEIVENSGESLQFPSFVSLRTDKREVSVTSSDLHALQSSRTLPAVRNLLDDVFIDRNGQLCFCFA